MAKPLLQTESKLAQLMAAFPFDESSMKAIHSSPAFLLKVPKMKPNAGPMNPEVGSEPDVHVATGPLPSKNVVIYHSDEHFSGGSRHMTLPVVSVQERNAHATKKKTTVDRSAQKFSFATDFRSAVKSPESNSQPDRSAVSFDEAQAVKSDVEEIQTPVGLQKPKSRPSKNLAIWSPPAQTHQGETVGREEEEQKPVKLPEDDPKPKRSKAVCRSDRRMSAEGNAPAGVRVKEASTQTDPVVIFIGNVGKMAERLRQLGDWNRNFVFDGNDVLVEVCDESDRKKQTPPDQQTVQLESDDDVICLGGNPNSEAVVPGPSILSSSRDKRHRRDERAKRTSIRKRWRHSSERHKQHENCGGEWQGLADEPCQGQLEGRPTLERRVRFSTGLPDQDGMQELDQTSGEQQSLRGKRWQDPSEKQQQDLNGKQWHVASDAQRQDQEVNENLRRTWKMKQWQARNEIQYLDSSEVQWQAFNAKQRQGPSELQCRDENVVSCRNQEVVLYQDPGEVHRQDKNVVSCHQNLISYQDQNLNDHLEQNVVSYPEQNMVFYPAPNVVSYPERNVHSDPDQNVVSNQNLVSYPDQNMASYLDQNVIHCEDQNVVACQNENLVPCENQNMVPSHDQNVVPCEVEDVVLLQDQNMASCEDQNMVPCHDQNMVPCHDEHVILCHDQSMVPCHDQNRVPCQDQNVVPCQEEDVILCQDQNMAPCHDQNMVPCQDEDVLLFQDQNMIPCQDQNMIPCQDQNMVPCQDQNMVPCHNEDVIPCQDQNIVLRQDQNDLMRNDIQNPEEQLQDPTKMPWPDHNKKQPVDLCEVQHKDQNEFTRATANDVQLEDPKHIQVSENSSEIQVQGPRIGESQDQAKKAIQCPEEVQFQETSDQQLWQEPNNSLDQVQSERERQNPNNSEDEVQSVRKRRNPNNTEDKVRSVRKRRNPNNTEDKVQSVRKRRNPNNSEDELQSVRKRRCPNEKSFEDPASTQVYGLRASRGQDPKENKRLDPNEKRGQRANTRGMQIRSRRRGRGAKLYTEIRESRSRRSRTPLEPLDVDSAQSMLTVFQDCLGFVEARRGRRIRVRGGVFRKSGGGRAPKPSPSKASGLRADWDEEALQELSDSGVLYQELNESQCLDKKRRASRRGGVHKRGR